MGGGPTGVWLSELADPYYAFQAAGLEVTVASIAGGAIPIDANSMGDPYFGDQAKKFMHDHAAFSALRPGTSLLCLHGRQKQMKRLATYTQFCQKAHVVLFATDVAARGLDFPQVAWGSASP